MHDPAAALQKAFVSRFKAGVPMVTGRVFDSTPMSVVFPYVQIGHTQSVPDDALCIDGATCTLTLHIWSRVVGAVEVRRISDQILSTTEGWLPDLSADGFRLVDMRCRSTQTTGDPDGISTHGIMTFEAETERL